MAINDLYCKITGEDNKHHSLGIFLDLSKAFDTLNHEILLHKQNTYGIRALQTHGLKTTFPTGSSMLPIAIPLPLIMILYAAFHKDQSVVHFYFFYTLMISCILRPPPTSLFSLMVLISFFFHKDPVQLEKIIHNELKKTSIGLKIINYI